MRNSYIYFGQKYIAVVSCLNEAMRLLVGNYVVNKYKKYVSKK